MRKRLVPFIVNKGSTSGYTFEFLNEAVRESVISHDGETTNPTPVQKDCKIMYSNGEGIESAVAGEVLAVNSSGSVGVAKFRLAYLTDSDAKFFVRVELEGKETLEIPVFPFKPDWWPDVDSVTGKPLLEGK